MNDLKDLARRAREFEKKLRKAASDAARDGIVEMTENLARATPVDTSRALSNWRATVGFPASREIEPYEEGFKGSTREASIQATVARAKSAVTKKKPGQFVFLTNNVDYMDDLNAGSSTQAEAGWIQATADITANNWKMKKPVF